MKKYIFPIAVIASLSLASCRKERTCSCTTTQTINGTGVSGSSKDMVGNATKREAKRLTDCYSFTQSETETILGTVYVTETTTECELD